MKETFNTTHPELLDGEVFMSNCNDKEYATSNWSTKRPGEIAYSISGSIVQGCFPVFIKRSEVENKYGKQSCIDRFGE